MIYKNIDIWAVLLLLLGSALVAGTHNVSVQVARARLELCRKLHPVEVRLTPFQLNRLPRAVKHTQQRASDRLI